MEKLIPSVQHYPWGSKTYLAQLQGQEVSEVPEAEYWYGAHPGAPAHLDNGESLIELIQDDPSYQLGDRVRESFGDTLPFLLKLLAAGAPLSLQAHPSKEQAEEGFARENAAGIDLRGVNRNYKDDNHKPELIMALTPFKAMAGFRPLAQTRYLCELLNCEGLNHYLPLLDAEGDEGENLRALFTTWITIPGTVRQDLITEIVEAIPRVIAAGPAEWIVATLNNIVTLNNQYPGDVGVLGALLLNFVTLEPGEGLYLSAGNLHAYVEGLGVEIMANSDNVLRGGLTSKHVDVPELVKVLRFESLADPMVKVIDGQYQVPIDEFSLQAFALEGGAPISYEHDGPAIALCTEGSVTVTNDQNEEVHLAPTNAVWLPAGERSCTFEGAGQLVVATV